MDPIAGLVPASRAGVFFVTGNHEGIHGDAAKWVTKVRATRVGGVGRR
jgi:hypothetical protein